MQTTQMREPSLVQLIAMSTMSDQEKAGWIRLLPVMTDEEKKNLEMTLQTEVSSITDIFLNALADRNK